MFIICLSFRSGEEGTFPQLEETTERKIESLDPKR